MFSALFTVFERVLDCKESAVSMTRIAVDSLESEVPPSARFLVQITNSKAVAFFTMTSAVFHLAYEDEGVVEVSDEEGS
jgi:hypothetical protein